MFDSLSRRLPLNHDGQLNRGAAVDSAGPPPLSIRQAATTAYVLDRDRAVSFHNPLLAAGGSSDAEMNCVCLPVPDSSASQPNFRSHQVSCFRRCWLHLLGCSVPVHRFLRRMQLLPQKDSDTRSWGRFLVCVYTLMIFFLITTFLSLGSLIYVVIFYMDAGRPLDHRDTRPAENVHRNHQTGVEQLLSAFPSTEELLGFLTGDVANMTANLSQDLKGVNSSIHDAQRAAAAAALPSMLSELQRWLGALHATDPDGGISGLSDFLIHVMGRRVLAEDIIRLQGGSSALSGGAPTPGPGLQRSEGLAEVMKAADTTCQLRAQIQGFVGVPPRYREREVLQPFDDIAVLQYRHALMAEEVVPLSIRRSSTREQAAMGNGATARPTAPPSSGGKVHSALQVVEAKMDLYQVSSIFNHAYYYPLRRYTQSSPYSPEDIAMTDAWYSAIAAVVLDRFDALPMSEEEPRGAVRPTARPLRFAPDATLSLLSLPFLTPRRQADVDYHFTSAERLLMPDAVDSPLARANTATIFISFASFRDVECPRSLLDLYRTARNPYRVYVGVAEQNHEVDPPCVPPELYYPMPCTSNAAAMPPSSATTAVPPLHGVMATTPSHATDPSYLSRIYTNYSTAFHQQRGQTPWLAGFTHGVCFFADNIRLRRLSAASAMGPTYGRYMAMLLYRGEALALILDSHYRFRPMWDTLGGTFLLKMKDPKAVLSHYPEAYSVSPSFPLYRGSTAYLCKAYFLSDFGFIRLNGIVVSDRTLAKNNAYNDPYVSLKWSDMTPADYFRMPQPWVAGGFLLSSASIFRDVPFDPHLQFTFDGEEVLYSLRLWTHGYNIYSPERSICYHYYTRQTAPRVWLERSAWHIEQQKTRARIQFLLQSHWKGRETLMVPRNTTNSYVISDANRYGMGAVRTVLQWYDYAGVDPVRHTVEGKWCGKDKNAET